MQKKKENNKQLTVNTELPLGPIKRPNKPAFKKPKRGKKTNNKYIKKISQ